jgi:hypothetical protein
VSTDGEEWQAIDWRCNLADSEGPKIAGNFIVAGGGPISRMIGLVHIGCNHPPVAAPSGHHGDDELWISAFEKFGTSFPKAPAPTEMSRTVCPPSTRTVSLSRPPRGNVVATALRPTRRPPLGSQGPELDVPVGIIAHRTSNIQQKCELWALR